MNIGVFIVGTSPLPIYISINNLIKNKIDKIFLLATEESEYSQGTAIYAKRLKGIFKNIDIEIVSIDKSNLKLIVNKLDSILETFINKEEVNIYLDFTGGTKIQSGFIREYFESNVDSKKDKLEIIYVDGYDKKILIKEHDSRNFRKVEFSDIDEGEKEEEEIVKEMLFLQGYSLDYEKKISIIKDIKNKNEIIRFDEIILNEYNLEFTKTLKNKLIQDKKDKGNKYKNKSKVKMEIFENIVHGEQVGGEFITIDFLVEDDRKDDYNVLINEFLGIKRDIYKDRIFFNRE